MSRDYSIQFNAYDFLDSDPVMGDLLLRFPYNLLPLLERAAVRAQEEILRQKVDDIGHPLPGAAVKGGHNSFGKTTRLHPRLVMLPPSRFKASLSRLQASDVGQMFQVCGTVVRASTIQMYESTRTYICKKTKHGGCGKKFPVHANVQQYNNALSLPETCPNVLENNQRCRGTKFVAGDPSESVHTDYQEIKIQESSSSNGKKTGHIPRSLLVKLQHDLVDRCQPGDQVVVVGSLLAQWHSDLAVTTKSASKNHLDSAEPDIGLALLAHSLIVVSDERSGASSESIAAGNSVSLDDTKKYRDDFDKFWQFHKDRPILARDYVCQAVCPTLYGLSIIKLSLLLTLIGGVSAEKYSNDDVEQSISQTKRDSNQMKNHDEDQFISQTNQDSGSMEEEQPLEVGNDLFVLEHRPKTQTQHHLDFALDHVGLAQQDRNSSVLNPASASESLSPSKAKDESKAASAAVQTRRRSQSHLLLVGDPGTGKSQVLRFAASLFPRSVLTTGVGTTSAGLTCAAIRSGSNGEFSLEAGALVLADQGVCCIDEFGCIREQDRTTIHEAMEQQHLSVAKGGIVCKLNCRATIVAVMNPKDCLYDNQTSLSINTGLGTPLLSRFDLIFKLVDTSDAARDDSITTYLLNQAIQGGTNANQLPTSTSNEEATPSLETHAGADLWSIEKLRAYITIVKELFCPVLSDEAAQLLEHHYKACRSCSSGTIPVTVRFLESLIRLSQAHARLMYRDTVELIDAVAVIRLMECSAFCYGGFDGPNFSDVNEGYEPLYRDPMTIDFTDKADDDLCVFECRILKRYNLLHLTTNERRDRAVHVLDTNMEEEPQSWADVGGGPQTLSTLPVTQDWSQHPQQRTPQEPGPYHQTSIYEVDHYGRTQCSQDVNMNGAKRRRQH
mmetsp:Transcript_18509/g.50547  ORF Transcript_18509/g.50547 Transcript_18509/m.50547 type:complete len:896 (+) Transcript_18509:5909-8596(+)